MTLLLHTTLQVCLRMWRPISLCEEGQRPARGLTVYVRPSQVCGPSLCGHCRRVFYASDREVRTDHCAVLVYVGRPIRFPVCCLSCVSVGRVGGQGRISTFIFK